MYGVEWWDRPYVIIDVTIWLFYVVEMVDFHFVP